MGAAVLWALLTGGITGGVWVTIVLLGRQRQLSEQYRGLQEELEQRLDQLDAVTAHVTQIEDRLDFTERILARERETGRLSPPATE
jgi:hypothetical protein